MGTLLQCRCGTVQLEVSGAPIAAAECHCSSCREAGKRMALLPGAPAAREANGGTQFVAYRKDRVRFAAGFEQLRWFRLGPDRSTRRIMAACCNTPVCLEFKGGHWLSLYSLLWPAGSAPAPELRTMLGDRKEGEALDDKIPAGGLATAGFYWRLLTAWIAMGFKDPKLELDGREIEVPGR
jgi:hypothetical protein